MNGKLWSSLSTGLLCLALSSTIHAGVEVIVQVSSSSEVVSPNGSPEAPTFGLINLRIEKGWVEAEDDGVRVIFDREGERLIALNPDSPDYDQNTLFALLEYRVSAYRMLNARNNFGYPRGSYGTGEPEVMGDHIFGFINPSNEAGPEMKETDRERSWFTGDAELANWTKKGVDLPAEQLDHFVFWMRQTSGGHPVITRDLVAQGILPDTTRLILNDGRVRKAVEFEVVGVRKVPDLSLDQRLKDLNRYTEGAGADTFIALLDWVVSRSAFAESISNDGTADNTAARTFFENGDPIRGILETVRVEMMTGQSPDVELEIYNESIDKSRTATNLLRSLGASSPESHAQAVQTLEVLSDAFEDQAGVLKLLTAQNLVMLEQFGPAENMYREVIMSEPNLALAYKNYGDLLRSSNRYPMGWLCYEAFGIVSPNHTAVAQIEQLKASFREAFPDFF